MIYFMQDIGGGAVKIGHTINLSVRHRELEEHYGRPLALLATMKGDRKREAEIHAKFADIRINGPKRRGARPEQFRPTAELMAFIGRPLLVDVNPDAIEAMVPVMKTIAIRGSGEWCAWLEEGARFLRLDVAKMIEIALADFAQKVGFNEPPPRRI